MNKGFALCRDELEKNPGDLPHSLRALSKALMGSVGGAMGPLYGMFFRSMAKACDGLETIDATVFGAMLRGARDGVGVVSEAKPGDKTLVDALAPAVDAYCEALDGGKPFEQALEAMTAAARSGREATKDMVAKIGRASRLGERSKGVLDPGAVSCCLILESMADAIRPILGKA